MSSARKKRSGDANLNASDAQTVASRLSAPIFQGAVTAAALVLALGATDSASAAEEWFAISSNAPNVTFFVDMASIERTGKLARFWEKLVFAKPDARDAASGKLIREKKVQRLVDCDEARQAVIYGSLYAEDGGFITSTTFDRPQDAMTAIPPGSVAARELDLVCKARHGTLFGIDPRD